MRPTPRLYLVLAGSLTAAITLTVLPIAASMEPFRPLWSVLIMLYWSLHFPHRSGIGIGWASGFLLDVLHGGLLGQHPLAMASTVYIAQRLHQRILVFPLWQQAISIGAMLSVYMTIVLWINGITGHAPGTWFYWAPLVTSSLMWPAIALSMDRLSRVTRLQ